MIDTKKLANEINKYTENLFIEFLRENGYNPPEKLTRRYVNGLNYRLKKKGLAMTINRYEKHQPVFDSDNTKNIYKVSIPVPTFGIIKIADLHKIKGE